MPTMNHLGVSRRIEDEKERKRLKEIVQPLLPKEGGFILRTACEGRSKREIQRDVLFLTKLWGGIQNKAGTENALSLIHQDLDLVARTKISFLPPPTSNRASALSREGDLGPGSKGSFRNERG